MLVPTRIAAMVCGLAVAVIAGPSLLVAVAAVRVSTFVYGFASGSVLSPAGAVRLADWRGAKWGVARSCRRDVMVGIGEIEAAAVQTLMHSGDVARIDPAVSRLETAARRLLDCSPGESIGWLWLALARDEKRAPTAEILDLMKRSRATGPSERWIVSLRLPFAAELASRRGAMFEDVVRADLRMLFSAMAPAEEVAEIVGPVFRWIRPIVREEFAGVANPTRREALIQAFGRRRANVSGCPDDKFVDWLYRHQHGNCETNDLIPQFDWKKSRAE